MNEQTHIIAIINAPKPLYVRTMGRQLIHTLRRSEALLMSEQQATSAVAYWNNLKIIDRYKPEQV